jgi:hypothetical protein
MVDAGETDSSAEQWHGLTVRARDGTVVGVVVGVFAEGPLAGRLRVHGDYIVRRHQAGPHDGIAVYAIPRSAVVRKRQDSLVVDATLVHARGKWLMHVLPGTQA